MDFSKLYFYDQLPQNGVGDIINTSTESAPGNDNWLGHIDGTVSALAYNDFIWGGLTVDHLLQPNVSFYSDQAITPIKFTIFGGYKLINQGRLLKPSNESLSLAMQYRVQGSFQQLDVGLYWFSAPLILGFWYRGIPAVNSQIGDAVSFLAGIKTYKLSFGYSYDFTVSNLINSTHGAHEISIIYEFYTKKRKKYLALPCPDF